MTSWYRPEAMLTSIFGAFYGRGPASGQGSVRELPYGSSDASCSPRSAAQLQHDQLRRTRPWVPVRVRVPIRDRGSRIAASWRSALSDSRGRPVGCAAG